MNIYIYEIGANFGRDTTNEERFLKAQRRFKRE